MVEIKQYKANKENYGSVRALSNIKYLVIHYTGNNGDTDEANAKYFRNRIVKASAHYFVDSDSITQSVPDNYVAYSVGGKKYSDCSKTGGGKFYGICTNNNSISIELCDDYKNDIVYPTWKTIANGIALAKQLMFKYNIKHENVIRHFDVVGKSCPAYWCGDSAKNELWKVAFWNRLYDTYPTLRCGDTGEFVLVLQKVLLSRNFKSCSINGKEKIMLPDGQFGPITEGVLKRFQDYADLVVDGCCGPKTWAKLV